MKFFRNVVKRFLSIGLINFLIVRGFKIFSFILPIRLLKKVPLHGVFSFQTTEGKSVLFYNKGDDRITSSLYFKGPNAFEPETVNIFNKMVKSTKVVFDIGANPVEFIASNPSQKFLVD